MAADQSVTAGESVQVQLFRFAFFAFIGGATATAVALLGIPPGTPAAAWGTTVSVSCAAFAAVAYLFERACRGDRS